MATDTRDFFPFVEEDKEENSNTSADINPQNLEVHYPARIAVYDDPTVTPRVVVIEPTNVRDYLASITETVTKLSHEQGGSIPFTIIREIVENYIHASFIEPTITILDNGATIRFCDQGPGIHNKTRALEFGTTSATEEMKRYIRGVGSGLPIAQQYMVDKGGSLEIQDNISGGTIVTISTKRGDDVKTAPSEAELTQNPSEVSPYPQDVYQSMPQPASPEQINTSAQSPSPYQQSQWWQPQQPPFPQQMPSQMPYQSYYPAYPAQQPQPQSAIPYAGFQQMSQPNTQNVGTNHQERQNISVSFRGRQILSYLAVHEEVGGTNLVAEFGGSQPTWSRELKILDELGLTHKSGQKRRLTEMGRTWLSLEGLL